MTHFDLLLLMEGLVTGRCRQLGDYKDMKGEVHMVIF